MIVRSDAEKEFFVWVDPADFMVKNNIGLVGSMGSFPPEHADPADLMFVFNPQHKQGFISRFHIGVIKNYSVEYDLERYRFLHFADCPSRLHSSYLFESRDDAEKYRITHQSHISGRVLKRGLTVGPYVFSRHDLTWIDFLRLPHSMDVDTLNFCWFHYWNGDASQHAGLSSMGVPWQVTSINECLLYGRVNFPNRSLAASD